MDFYSFFQSRPIIPSVSDSRDIYTAAKGHTGAVLITHGSIFNLREIVREISEKQNKMVLVHLDLLEGFGKDRTTIEYLKKVIHVDGIVTTNAVLIQYAKAEGLITMLRFFAHDSTALHRGIGIIHKTKPDMVCVMPGTLCSEVYAEITKLVKHPLVAAGLVKSNKQVRDILQCGVMAVNTSEKKLWGRSF